MTTWLRYVGASIMGILDPVRSTAPSPMTEDEASWVRAHAWPKALHRIDEAYPHGFHRWCSCERGICHSCACTRHEQCVSATGPRVDTDAGTVTDRGGFVVAVIQHGPTQRPCRWICPCTHPSRSAAPARDSAAPPHTRRAAASPPDRTAAGQLSFPFTAPTGLPERDGGTR